jgi:hypothetical protein
VTWHAGYPGTSQSSRFVRDHRTGRRTQDAGSHREHTGKVVGRARIGRTDQKWARDAIPCDNPYVEREHANRHQGSELLLRALIFWMDRVDRRQPAARGPTTAQYRPSPKTALRNARLHSRGAATIRIARNRFDTCLPRSEPSAFRCTWPGGWSAHAT